MIFLYLKAKTGRRIWKLSKSICKNKSKEKRTDPFSANQFFFHEFKVVAFFFPNI
ncbi:predicted protein [Listeria monocytogenes FSL R2-503]|nr:predicted protein [Listeria monocytogenes FSL R2-503]